ncbi:MAG: transcriptional repressor [Tissierellia bacterium]|nr:transcriptional repressor [Tissierellia bacterium]
MKNHNERTYYASLPFRMTGKRKRILEMIQSSATPLSAAKIYEGLLLQEDGIWLSTVYRALELFEEHGLIQRETLPGTEETVYIAAGPIHRHYGLCIQCQKIFDIENCPMETYTPKFEDESFQVLEHRFTVLGLCGNCSHHSRRESSPPKE